MFANGRVVFERLERTRRQSFVITSPIMYLAHRKVYVVGLIVVELSDMHYH